MPFIGNNDAGTGSATSISTHLFGHFDSAYLVSWNADTPRSCINKFWFYGRNIDPGFDSINIQIGIYDASDGDYRNWTLVATSSELTIAYDEDYAWHVLEDSIFLDPGTYVLAVIVSGGSGDPDYLQNKNTTKNSAPSYKNQAGAFDSPLGECTSNVYNLSMYAEYTEIEEGDFTDDIAGSFPILAPVEPYPILTSGQSPTSVAGHEPEYAIDGNLNTYWEPSSSADNSIWFDLGDPTMVYAIVIWLHNYNELWATPKSWQISYSTDDVEYATFTEKVFDDYRDAAGPVLDYSHISEILEDHIQEL